MEYRSQIVPPALASAVTLFARLNTAGVRYGIFKSSRNTLTALAGDQDLDILVAREDYSLFCAIAFECAGVRSTNHGSLVSPAREDWFIPDFERARYLHLDVHTSVRLGGKFNKRYPCYSYRDIRHWDMVRFGGCSIPVASPEDEAGITLSRVAFRASGKVSGSWQILSGDWVREIDELLFAGAETGDGSAWCGCAGLKLRCRVRKHGNEIRVHREDLANVRRLVRARCGAPTYSPLIDPIRNSFRTWSYGASRLVNRIFPGSVMDRRRPTGGGLIVAVVAPDGMGKTTQVERMHKLFSWKFSCAALYLGTGDGQGWWIRRLLRTFYIRRRSQIKATLLTDPGTGKYPRTLARKAGPLLLALWGILVALERYRSVQAARRMADRGFIVFCDRWPQRIQPGFMDGPTQPPGNASPTWLRRWELLLYDRMARVQPDVAVQLVADYAISDARKPGELTREEYDKRISLMQELRNTASPTYVIDAARSIDEVSRSLFGLIWSAL